MSNNAETKYCRECGESMHQADRYCPHCGTDNDQPATNVQEQHQQGTDWGEVMLYIIALLLLVFGLASLADIASMTILPN